MITAHLAFIGFLLRRPRPGRAGPSLNDQAAGFGRALRAMLNRRLRQHAPPSQFLNDHLRRDIGLPPFHDAGDWYRIR